MSLLLRAAILSLPLLGTADAVAEGGCSQNATADELAAGISLAHKVAVITGGDSGLGYAVAEAFAHAGATLVIAGHSADKSADAARNLSKAFGVDVRGMSVDLGSFASVRALFSNISKAFPGPVHFLVNDAGITTSRGHDTTEDGFETIFQTNYLGHFLLTELLLPALRRSGEGRIVNVASTSSLSACTSAGWPQECLRDFTYLPPPKIDQQPIPGTTAKAGLYGLSKMMMIQHAAELSVREAAAGVKAYSIGVGVVATPLTGNRTAKLCKNIAKIGPGYEQIPCPYTPQQGAAVVAFCALHNPRPGGWFVRYTDCREDPPVFEQGWNNGFTAAMRPELYNRTLQWVGLPSSWRNAASPFVV